MKVVPQWSYSMSVRDPVLDTQHIELLELCRAVQDMAHDDRQKSAPCALWLEEIVYALRKHGQFEINRLLDRGEGRLSKQQCINRANALQQLEELALAAPLRDMHLTKLQTLLCCWIQHHLH